MAVMREGVSIMTSDSVSRDKNSMSDFKKKRARNIFFGDEVSARKSERVCLLESRVQKMADNEVPAGAPQTTLAHHDAHLSFTEHRRRLGGNLVSTSYIASSMVVVSLPMISTFSALLGLVYSSKY